MKNKSIDWWSTVMFSDESTFQQVRNSGSNYVRRPTGERLNPKYTIKNPPSVMVWGAITAAGISGLHIFDKDEKVNAVKHISVLESKVKLHMNVSRTTMFQQDSAPCHTDRTVQKWLAGNKIHLLSNWPSNSSDLKVFENC